MAGERFALIGYGGMAGVVVRQLPALSASGLEFLGVLARPGRSSVVRERLGAGVRAFESLDELLRARPAVVAECAGHGALVANGAALLERGVDLVAASTGALSDDALLAGLRAAAAAGGSRLTIPAGGVGAIDALAAMRLMAIDKVRYRSRKPPIAWRGTPAEQAVDLDALREATVVYRGSARDAARLYPKNANVAATIALAGVGFERTEVEIVADPAATMNVHEIEARGEAAELNLRLANVPLVENPKTSSLSGLSVARALANRNAALAI